MLERIDDMAGIAVVKAKYLGFKAKEKFVDFVTKEDGDVNVVSIVILIGIASCTCTYVQKTNCYYTSEITQSNWNKGG